MDFICAELLGLTHSFQLLGELANYRDVQVISIQGRVTGERGRESISGVWSGMQPYFNYTGYEAISVNGYSLGTGRLLSINFNESIDTVSKTYSASFEIIKTGNLWNFTGAYYSGLYGPSAAGASDPAFGSEDLYNIKYLNSFQEDSVFSSKKSGEYQYDKSISMDIDGSYTGNSLSFFESVKNKLFSEDPQLQLINSIYPSYYVGPSSSSITSESISYDDINRKYSASQSFNFDDSNPWTWNYKHTLNTSAEGHITASENGEIKSSRSSGSSNSYYSNLGWQQIQTGIFNRVTGFYQYYVTGTPNNIYSGACSDLINFPVQSSLSKNNLIGTISYGQSYTDNPAQNSGYSFSYQNDISLNNGNIDISENGRYKGFYDDRVSGFNAVYAAYQSGIEEIYSRTTGFYTGSLPLLLTCTGDRSISNIKKDETYREYFQEIQYSYLFSDDRDVVNDDNFYRISSTYSDQKPVLQVGYFNIPNDAEIAQRQNQSTLGTFSNQINIIGKPNTILQTYISGAAQKLIAPTGSEVFISDINYNFAKNQNQFNLSVVYSYSDYPSIPDLLV